MSAAQQRHRGRPSGSRPGDRSGNRRRQPEHVAPVLDPTWQSPYAPSNAEREANRTAIRHAWARRQRPILIGAVVIFLVSLALTFVDWYMPLIGLGIATILAFWSIGRLRSLEAAVPTLATSLRGAFVEGGSVQERQRLSTIVDRLAATFGLHEVTALIIVDEAYNATLLLEEEGLLLLVTSALVRDFELIEIEGVVAHLMARHRLGLLEREAAAALSGYPVADAHRLAGTSQAYRADEVAAAGIRYPLGLSQALSRCAEQRVPPGSFFASARYDETRWVWFNIYSDRTTSTDGDVDDAVVRARALAEW